MKANKYTLGWSDIELFFDFRKRALCYSVNQVYFYEQNYKKSANLAKRARQLRGKVFTFKKSQGP